MCMWVSLENEEGTGSSRAQVTGGSESPNVNSRNNLSLLEEQQKPLTADLPLQHYVQLFYISCMTCN